MHLFILEDEITKLLRKLERVAFDLKSKMDNKSSIEVLKGRLEVFNTNYQDLLSKISPEILKKTNLTRHVSFLKKYIESGSVESCYKDIEDICNTDIEEVRKGYLESINLKFLDHELNATLQTLLQSNELDSAVRKAFLILTERLREKYGIQKDKDGVDLINLIYGKAGKSNLADSERESFRNFLAGFHGIFRNDFMHNLKNRKNSEIPTIYMINTILRLLENADEKPI